MAKWLTLRKEICIKSLHRQHIGAIVGFRGMIFDMHVHTALSGDSSATVEDYCRAIQRYREHHPIDGIAITEHRLYRGDEVYKKIGDAYGVVILQGIEVNADLGHLLLYGVTNRFLDRFDISSLRLESRNVIEAMDAYGGIAVPAHPFRESRYGEMLNVNEDRLSGITVVEERNGSNTSEQNRKAEELVAGNGLKGIGGSDAHYANRHWFLNCATEFDGEIETIDDMVGALRNGSYRPISLNGSVLEDF